MKDVNLGQSYICLLLFLFFCGCASTSSNIKYHIEKSRVYSVSFDAAWQKIIQTVIGDCDLINLAEKESGILAFQRHIPVKDIDRYALNDSGLLLDRTLANIFLVVSREDDQHVRITINTRIAATGRSLTDVFLSRNRQVLLPSKGVIEKDCFDRFKALSASPASGQIN